MTFSRKTKSIGFFSVLITSVFVLFQNCGGVAPKAANNDTSVTLSSISPSGLSSPQTVTTSNVLNNTGGKNFAMQNLNPAMVVRGTSCVMCHANLTGNVITDFGFGSPWFFGTEGGTAADIDGGNNWYGDCPTCSTAGPNWGSATFNAPSQVFVPKANTSAISSIMGATSLAGYIKNVLAASPVASTQAAAVNEVSSVYIGAPTLARIRQIGSLTTTKMINFIPASSVSPPFSGITLQNGYYTNTGPVICDGDLVVDGIVWLNSATFASHNGCRIYATHTVYISGPITFSTVVDSTLQNLQISSATAILLGIGRAPCGGDDTFTDRLTYNGHNGALRPASFVTRNFPTGQLMFDAITADNNVMGNNVLDVTCAPVSQPQTTGFNHLLLNAPVVESRYTGDLQGSVIAELALFSKAVEFYVTYDPIFKQVQILPLLKTTEYLDVQP